MRVVGSWNEDGATSEPYPIVRVKSARANITFEPETLRLRPFVENIFGDHALRPLFDAILREHVPRPFLRLVLKQEERMRIALVSETAPIATGFSIQEASSIIAASWS